MDDVLSCSRSVNSGQPLTCCTIRSHTAVVVVLVVHATTTSICITRHDQSASPVQPSAVLHVRFTR